MRKVQTWDTCKKCKMDLKLVCWSKRSFYFPNRLQSFQILPYKIYKIIERLTLKQLERTLREEKLANGSFLVHWRLSSFHIIVHSVLSVSSIQSFDHNLKFYLQLLFVMSCILETAKTRRPALICIKYVLCVFLRTEQWQNGSRKLLSLCLVVSGGQAWTVSKNTLLRPRCGLLGKECSCL